MPKAEIDPVAVGGWPLPLSFGGPTTAAASTCHSTIRGRMTAEPPGPALPRRSSLGRKGPTLRAVSDRSRQLHTAGIVRIPRGHFWTAGRSLSSRRSLVRASWGKYRRRVTRTKLPSIDILVPQGLFTCDKWLSMVKTSSGCSEVGCQKARQQLFGLRRSHVCHFFANARSPLVKNVYRLPFGLIATLHARASS